MTRSHWLLTVILPLIGMAFGLLGYIGGDSLWFLSFILAANGFALWMGSLTRRDW